MRDTRARLAVRVAATRGLLMTGLTAQQYTDTVDALSVMAGNIEAALAGPAGGDATGR